MTKKYLVVLLALTVFTNLSGCTSSGGKDDSAQSNDSQFSQEGQGDFAQDSGESGGAPQDQIAQDQVAQDGGQGGAKKDDAAPQDGGQDLALDGQQEKKPDASGAVGKDELALDDPSVAPAPLPDDVATNPAAPADAQAPKPEEVASAAPAPAPTDEPLFKNEAKSDAGAPTDATAMAANDAPATPKSFAPLQKVKETAFDKNGTNLNRVYLARPGDKLAGISQKLYGKNRSKDLKSWNPIIASRSPKTGDKIYYQSPSNPDDTKMLTYYEEAGIQPSVYTTKDGDNLRKVSKQLLGSNESWKEVWSTNLNVESKGDVPAGVELKYWPQDAIAKSGDGGGAKDIAANAPPMDQNAPPPPQDMAVNVPPPPPPDMAPPPPPPPPPAPASTPDKPTAAGAIAPPPDMAPPPPPPPPPPEPKPVVKKTMPVKDDAGGDPDQMMMIGIGGILIMAAAVLFVVLRRNRAKRVDLSQTQV